MEDSTFLPKDLGNGTSPIPGELERYLKIIDEQTEKFSLFSRESCENDGSVILCLIDQN